MKRRKFLTCGALAIGAGAAEGQAADPRQSELDRIAAVVRQEFDGRLTDEQLEEISRQISSNLDSAAALRQTPLRNGDEPILHPSLLYRGEKT